MKKPCLLIAASVLVLCSCQSGGDPLGPVSRIPPSVSPEGTLANAKLTQDATLALYENLRISAAALPQTRIMKFVIQQPVGNPGKKAWRELWIVTGPEGSGEFIVTFREDGTGSADFEIQ